VDEEKVWGIVFVKWLQGLDDEEFLNVIASTAFAHAVPRSVGKAGANSPHDWYSGLSSTCSLLTSNTLIEV
jgi:hypothetical protein